jgi:hypothetical protein
MPRRRTPRATIFISCQFSLPPLIFAAEPAIFAAAPLAVAAIIFDIFFFFIAASAIISSLFFFSFLSIFHFHCHYFFSYRLRRLFSFIADISFYYYFTCRHFFIIFHISHFRRHFLSLIFSLRRH